MFLFHVKLRLLFFSFFEFGTHTAAQNLSDFGHEKVQCKNKQLSGKV
jgi:hypothetical protein